MENQDGGLTRIPFVLRGWIRIRSISDRILNPANEDSKPIHFCIIFFSGHVKGHMVFPILIFLLNCYRVFQKDSRPMKCLIIIFLQGVWRNKAVPGGNQTTRTGNININIAMRVYSHSYWLAIFWTNNIGQVLARNNRRKYWKFLE